MDILDILLDESNREPITLTDDFGKTISFEQIAVIPHDNKIYCVLKPVDKLEGVEDDEAIVFYVDQDDDGYGLRVEADEKAALSVFEKYYDMLEEFL